MNQCFWSILEKCTRQTTKWLLDTSRHVAEKRKILPANSYKTESMLLTKEQTKLKTSTIMNSGRLKKTKKTVTLKHTLKLFQIHVE